MAQRLSSKERAFLRKLAHGLTPVVRIGKEGMDENVLKSIAEVVKKRELIKVKILQNSAVKFDIELVNEIAKNTKSIFVDKIGNVLIFFKPKSTKDAVITPELNEFKKKKNKN